MVKQAVMKPQERESTEVESDISYAQRLMDEYRIFMENFDDRPSKDKKAEVIHQKFYEHEELGVILQRIFRIGNRYVMLREPAIPSGIGTYSGQVLPAKVLHEVDDAHDESDEPSPKNPKFIFELTETGSLSESYKWSVRLEPDNSLVTNSPKGYDQGLIVELAESALRNMA